MSAAENLKALEAAIDALINAAPQKSEGEFATAALPLLFDVSNALPQIVALVEAAEKIRGDVPWSTGAEVHNALAALDEALGPPTGGSP